MSKLLRKKGGKKYVFTVVVHDVVGIPPSVGSSFKVELSRGAKAKAVSTRPGELDPDGAPSGGRVSWDETLNLVCTLYDKESKGKDGSSLNVSASSDSQAQYQKKQCRISVKEQGSKKAKTVARVDVDLVEFLSTPDSATKVLSLDVPKKANFEATVTLSISAKPLKSIIGKPPDRALPGVESKGGDRRSSGAPTSGDPNESVGGQSGEESSDYEVE
eukprot:GFYU01016609.1.p1 GENE.GFYU01016609.1~~GFYU01016609.1.p1  ORF type:complete len:217 (+),score=42.43 GFYU01016609.1:138-788(+)